MKYLGYSQKGYTVNLCMPLNFIAIRLGSQTKSVLNEIAVLVFF